MLLNERRMRGGFVKDANVCVWRCRVYEKDRFIFYVLNSIQKTKNKSVFQRCIIFQE